MTITKLFRLIAACSLFSIGLLLFNQSVLAEMYKWTDKNNQVHYGQYPPDKYQAQAVAEPDTRADSPPPGVRKQISVKKDSKPTSVKAKQKAQNTKRCAIAQKNIALLKKPHNIVRKKDGDQVSVVTHDERGTLIKTQQDLVDQYCS